MYESSQQKKTNLGIQTSVQPAHVLTIFTHVLKDAVSGLRQFRATESLLKLMKNAFYFILEALFVLKIFKLLS